MDNRSHIFHTRCRYFPPEIRSHSQSRHFPAHVFLLVLMSLVLDYELEIRDYSQSRKRLQEDNRAKPSNR